jgi:hypothetical protein
VDAHCWNLKKARTPHHPSLERPCVSLDSYLPILKPASCPHHCAGAMSHRSWSGHSYDGTRRPPGAIGTRALWRCRGSRESWGPSRQGPWSVHLLLVRESSSQEVVFSFWDMNDSRDFRLVVIELVLVYDHCFISMVLDLCALEVFVRCESQRRTQSRINVFFVQGGILCVYVCGQAPRKQPVPGDTGPTVLFLCDTEDIHEACFLSLYVIPLGGELLR